MLNLLCNVYGIVNDLCADWNCIDDFSIPAIWAKSKAIFQL